MSRSLLSVACPYCKAGIGESCHVNRRNVSIAVLGVHRPRARKAQYIPGRTVDLQRTRGTTKGTR